MSGPKVINLEAVRRRQERECRALLRSMSDLVAEWRQALEQAGRFTDESAADIAVWFARMETLRQGAQWQSLLEELTARRNFIRANTAEARAESVRRRAELHERRRRLILAAGMLLREYQARGHHAHAPGLEAILQDDDAAEPDEAALDRMEAVVQAALRELPAADPSADSAVTRRQAELAQALRPSETPSGTPRTVAEWLMSRDDGGARHQAVQDRLARALAELELRAPPRLCQPLLARARDIARVSSADQRALLTDSLLLDADELCRTVSEREQSRRGVREKIAALAAFASAEADAWRQRLTAAIDNPDSKAVDELVTAAQGWLVAEAEREDAAARREILLRSLAALGYEVREGMATAWAEQGRVIVRRPSDPDYGVEFASPPAGSSASVQARVVAFDGPGRSAQSAQRDREMENTWCDDFQRLRDLLTAEGFKPALLHATPAGVAPVKVVPAPEAARRDRASPREALRRSTGGG